MGDDAVYTKPQGVPERAAAGGVVVRREGGEILVALARETKQPGLILPKGGIKPGETPEAAARREIAEEAGFTRLTLAGELGTRERMSSSGRRWVRTVYFLYLTDEVDVRPQDVLAPPVVWVRLAQLPAMRWAEQRELIESSAERIRQAVLGG